MPQAMRMTDESNHKGDGRFHFECCVMLDGEVAEINQFS